jgi:hypothetical protein
MSQAVFERRRQHRIGQITAELSTQLFPIHTTFPMLPVMLEHIRHLNMLAFQPMSIALHLMILERRLFRQRKHQRVVVVSGAAIVVGVQP